MKSNDQGTGPPKELAQLLRVRQVRVDSAAAVVQEQKRTRQKAIDDVETAKTKLEDSNTELTNFADYMVNDGAADLPRLMQTYDAYNKRLKNEVVQSEEGLVRENTQLTKAEQKLVEVQQHWRREQARRDGVESALKRSKVAEARDKERKAEAEVEEMVSSRRPRDVRSDLQSG